MEVITKSAQETKDLGKKLAADLKGGELLALTGELGSGKTTFVQGLAKGLGIKQRAISPTFILMRSYKCQVSGVKNFYHIDLYRLENNVEREVRNLGIEEIWDNPKNIVVIEWAEKIKNILPKNKIWIEFENLGEDKRKIKIARIEKEKALKELLEAPASFEEIKDSASYIRKLRRLDEKRAN